MLLTLYDIQLSAQVAIIALVWSRMIVAPGEIGQALWLHLDRLNAKGFGWIAKPLGYCTKCFAGQLGVWLHLWAFGLTGRLPFFVALCILSAYMISKLIEKFR